MGNVTAVALTAAVAWLLWRANKQATKEAENKSGSTLPPFPPYPTQPRDTPRSDSSGGGFSADPGTSPKVQPGAPPPPTSGGTYAQWGAWNGCFRTDRRYRALVGGSSAVITNQLAELGLVADSAPYDSKGTWVEFFLPAGQKQICPPLSVLIEEWSASVPSPTAPSPSAPKAPVQPSTQPAYKAPPIFAAQKGSWGPFNGCFHPNIQFRANAVVPADAIKEAATRSMVTAIGLTPGKWDGTWMLATWVQTQPKCPSLPFGMVVQQWYPAS